MWNAQAQDLKFSELGGGQSMPTAEIQDRFGDYLDAIRRLESIDDPDQGRRKIHKDLIKRLRAANRAMKQP